MSRAEPMYGNAETVKLSDGSDLGISTETIASPGHTLGLCPTGMIWFKVIRGVIAPEYSRHEVRQFWIHVPLPRDVEEVKQRLAVVRKKDNRISWMFLYLSELTPQQVEWFTPQDWENVQAWLATPRILQCLRDALELCHQQHESNIGVPCSTGILPVE